MKTLKNLYVTPTVAMTVVEDVDIIRTSGVEFVGEGEGDIVIWE